MSERSRLWLGFVLVVLLFVAGCSRVKPTPYPSEVDWATAVQILNTGKVEMVMQAHSLDITLTMKDGSSIHTVEPQIDAIFDEIDKCGKPCGQIALATE